MKKDTSKLEEHIKNHPTDASAVISLLKNQSSNYEYDFKLNQKRKLEKMKSIARKRRNSNAN